jgi:hypothetical protein
MKEWSQLMLIQHELWSEFFGRNERLFFYCEEAHRGEDEVRKIIRAADASALWRGRRG